MKNDVTDQFRLRPGKKFRLNDFDPAWHGGRQTKKDVAETMARNLERLKQAQDLLYATEERALLVVLQAMDTAGKDGLIKHVMTGLNPQSCHAFPFKQPSSEELKHDFLWRYSQKVPARGQIAIFNRSYYEEVLVVRVHPEWIEKQKLPPGPRGGKFWAQRYEAINSFEQHLVRSGTTVLKFYLNLSKDEQRRRLLARLDDPKKLWKFSPYDLAERAHWDEYMTAYEDALGATSTDEAPWYVIPADHKWVSRWLVSEVLAQTMESFGLKYPKPTKEQVAAVEESRKSL